jgi:DNA-binding beta-propeller fold protein YncE
MALTHDGKYLIVADYSSVAVLDVAKVEAGQADAVLGTIPTGEAAVTIEVTVSLDDAYLFATDEHEAPPFERGDITVIDLHRALTGAFSEAAIVSQVPLDFYPGRMALSPNGADLYVTNRFSVSSSSGYVPSPAASDLGSLMVVDVARAESDPQHAVVAKALAGCGPVGVVLSPAGDIAWVSAQLQNAVLALDTAKLASDPGHALLATVPTGPAPTGMALIENGSDLLIACSNRFAGPTTRQDVMLLDTQRALHGQSALVGSIPVGAFPREIALDQSLALVTNFGSQSLSVIDTTTLPA